MEKINVLVTSVGGFSHGSSIVKALLCSKLNLNIIGVDASSKTINSSPLIIKEVVPFASDKKYYESIKNIIKKYSIHCIFTGSEQELVFWNENRNFLKNDCKIVLFLNSNEVINLCKNKYLCSEKILEMGFSIPETIIINNLNACDRIKQYPVIIKPNIESGASANIYFASNKEELLFISDYLIKNKIEIIIQQYIPYNNNEYTVGITSDMETGKIYSSIVLQKFLEGPTKGLNLNNLLISSGITQGNFVQRNFINDICENIAYKLGSKGPLNIQLRVLNNKIYPFEINPRFSGTTSARAFNGYNEPEFFIRKYILNDSKSYDSLLTKKTGFVVKGLDEIYVEQ